MTFSIIHASNLCLRGSRVKWRTVHTGLGFENGVVLNFVSHYCTIFVRVTIILFHLFTLVFVYSWFIYY